MSPLPHVTIVLVNWNGLPHTRECVRHCLTLDYGNFDLVIVDNGSSDGSLEVLTAELKAEPRVTIVPAGRNLGFAGACNLALAKAMRDRADFIWLLNNDTKVTPTTLGELIEAALAHPRAGILGSKILYWDRPDTIWYAGGFIQKTGPRYSLHRGWNEIDRGQYQTLDEVEYVTGCSLLVRARTVREIHFMSEDYFLYWEDADWCTRARQAGWSCLHVPRSVVYHRVGASSGRDPDRQHRYETRNRLMYHWRFNKLAATGALLALGVHSAGAVCRRDFRVARAFLAGACDFLMGRSGRLNA